MTKIDYLSFTGFKTGSNCREQYKHLYIDRNRPDQEDQRNTLKGNALHHLLEFVIEECRASGDNDYSLFRKNALEFWNREVESVKKNPRQFVLWLNSMDEMKQRDTLVEWAGRLGDMLEKRTVQMHLWESEFKADRMVTLGQYTFKMAGRIDVLAKTKSGENIFFDLKASINNKVQVLDQLRWYSFLLEQYLNEPVPYGGYLLPGFKTEKSQFRMHRVSQEDKDDLVRRIILFMDQMGEDDFKPDPVKGECHWCPVKNLCSIKGTVVPSGKGIVNIGGDFG